jgi:hypothetical protein
LFFERRLILSTRTEMGKFLRLLCLSLVLASAAGCASAPAPIPANYYENDLHHGYPGPGVTDPSAM